MSLNPPGPLRGDRPDRPRRIVLRHGRPRRRGQHKQCNQSMPATHHVLPGSYFLCSKNAAPCPGRASGTAAMRRYGPTAHTRMLRRPPKGGRLEAWRNARCLLPSFETRLSGAPQDEVRTAEAANRLAPATGTGSVAARNAKGGRERVPDESRKGRHRHHARRGAHLAVRLPAGCRGTLPGAVCRLAIPIRDGRRAGLSAVSLARDRPDRVVCRAGLRLCPRRRARRGPLRGRVRVHGTERAAGLCRADRLDHRAGLEQRPRRRHRPVVLRDGAMADGDHEPAGAGLHRALRRPGRPVSLLELPRRHLLQLPLGLVHLAARRQSAPPRRPARPARR